MIVFVQGTVALAGAALARRFARRDRGLPAALWAWTLMVSIEIGVHSQTGFFPSLDDGSAMLLAIAAETGVFL